MTIALPELYLEKQKQLLGAEYSNFINSYEQPASKGLRINTLKRDVAKFLQDAPFTLKPVPWCSTGYYYGSDERPGKHPAHAAGLYYIQEPSAMSVASILDPQPGETILDMAAAPGGKATQIAVMMENQGLLVANEIHPTRAKALSENVERMGITNTIVTNEEADRLAHRFPSYFDRILLDAPCSGEGMFRKDENARLEWSPQSVQVCSARQSDLLEHAAILLKPGGRLVYSTCTFSPEENEQVIEQFLLRHPDWSLLPISKEHGLSSGNPNWGLENHPELAKTARLWPHLLTGEGHFIALLEKGGDHRLVSHDNRSKMKKRDTKLAEAIHLFKIFADDTLNESCNHTLSDWERLILFGAHLYLLPKNAPSLDQLRVVRAGLHLGEVKKNRFEPSHSLALALEANDFNQTLSLAANDAQLTAFLQGEALSVNANISGWIGVLVDRYPIGWGKASNGILKNHYPKGLRLKSSI